MDKERDQSTQPTEEQFYHSQIIGLTVKTTTGELVGTVTDILSGKSNDNYVVEGKRGEVLIPAIEDVIREIDLEAGVITIEAIEGLLELNEKSR